ncbi:hypothetical protein SBOR_2268 [Sclerotinia borealis F-4128]|uniref:Uncharacterized protein n=1 Tax=Sclerotinia borealis (strain F-4128) TaxID=1432307 RepID=W9CMU6_SCLBF|nr:hypothetical protein SBOR_2268 [Sclerotinia borealis F-4128]
MRSPSCPLREEGVASSCFVLDILTASHDRVDRRTYKNIPDGERHWMAERWAWETLFADEMEAFPGEKPKWKGAAKYLEHQSPEAGESSKDTQAEASDLSELPEVELIPSSQLKTWRQQVDASVSKRNRAAPVVNTHGTSSKIVDGASASLKKPRKRLKTSNHAGTAIENTPKTSAVLSTTTLSPLGVDARKIKRDELIFFVDDLNEGSERPDYND